MVATVAVQMLPLATRASQDAVSIPSPVGSAEVISVGSGLLVVIAAVFLVGFLYSKTRSVTLAGNNVIKIIATQTLGPKERIVLIDVADKQLIVGMTTSQVQTLHVFDEPVVQTTGPPVKFRFADRLKTAMYGGRK